MALGTLVMLGQRWLRKRRKQLESTPRGSSSARPLGALRNLSAFPRRYVSRVWRNIPGSARGAARRADSGKAAGSPGGELSAAESPRKGEACSERGGAWADDVESGLSRSSQGSARAAAAGAPPAAATPAGRLAATPTPASPVEAPPARAASLPAERDGMRMRETALQAVDSIFAARTWKSHMHSFSAQDRRAD